MRGDNYDGPARTVYEALRAQPPLTAAEYGALTERLRPLYLEEVVCPVHLAASQLQAAAHAAAACDPDEAVTAHQTARARLYDALWHAGLLTVDEELQELAADLPPEAAHEDTTMRVRATDRLLMRQWQAWRTDDPP